MFLNMDAFRSPQDVAGNDYDVCIVGSGPAGLTVARRFFDTGKKVLILESGGGPDPVFVRDLMSGEVESGGKNGKLTYALPAGSGLHLSRFRGFGGTMNIWTGRIRPLDPSDFLRQVFPGGWSLTFDDLRPWYELALNDFGVAGLADYRRRLSELAVPFFPFNSRMFADIALKSWIRVFRNFAADLYSPIASSTNVHCLLDATVTGFRCSGSIERNRVDHLTFKNSGNESFEVRARHYVLACGGMENARLLLLARKDAESFAPAGDNAWVGRGFMEHFFVPVGRLMFRDSGNFRLNNPYFEDARTRSDYAMFLGPSESFIMRSNISNGTIGIDSENPDMACSSPWKFARMVAEYEQLPNPDSRITLSDREVDALGSPRIRVEWRMLPEDKIAMLQMTGAIAKAMYSFGGRVKLENQFLPEVPYLQWSGFGSHHMGTTRMSANASTGVVDRDLRVHGTDNLFVAGSSVFPTGGASNPTLTIVALSQRLAAHLQGVLKHAS